MISRSPDHSSKLARGELGDEEAVARLDAEHPDEGLRRREFLSRTAAAAGGVGLAASLPLDALVSAAAKLPRIAIEKPRTNSVMGRNTEDQMTIGVFWGYVAMMEGLIARMRAEIGRPARVVATGGLAILFDAHSSIFDAVDADLTLDGLAILAGRAA